MNKRQFKILSLPQWIFYPVAALMLLAFLADAFGGYRYWTDAVWGFFGRAEDPAAIIVIGLFCIVLVALVWQFLLIGFSRPRLRRKIGPPLIELHRPRFPTRFILPVLAAFFVVGISAMIFVPGTVDFSISGPGPAPLLFLFFFCCAAHFLLTACEPSATCRFSLRPRKGSSASRAMSRPVSSGGVTIAKAQRRRC